MTLHFRNQGAQPYGSRSRKCDRCGVMLWPEQDPDCPRFTESAATFYGAPDRCDGIKPERRLSRWARVPQSDLAHLFLSPDAKGHRFACCFEVTVTDDDLRDPGNVPRCNTCQRAAIERRQEGPS